LAVVIAGNNPQTNLLPEQYFVHSYSGLLLCAKRSHEPNATAFGYPVSDEPLYRRELLRLAADATGAGHLAAPDASATVTNPACGDKITVELSLRDGRVAALAHDTRACILTQASAALLAAQAPGAALSELTAAEAAVKAFLAGGDPPPGYQAFAGAADHPGRHICVLLPLQAALKALGHQARER
jgi:NifU-like protein involved in Fe-S cluster formation